MKTVILAAGLGTRVQHLYPNTPKVMLPLEGKPLLEHTIERLKSQGFSDFVMNLHYYPEVITDYFGDGSKFGVSIQYSFEEELLEVAGALKKMEPMLDTEAFVLVYGDMYFNRNIADLVTKHKENNAFGTLTVKKTKHIPQSDMLEIDQRTNRVVACHTRPHKLTEDAPNLFANVGLHVWSREILDSIPAGKKMSLDREVTPVLFNAGKPLYADPIREGEVVVDMGKPDNITMVEAMLAAKN